MVARHRPRFGRRLGNPGAADRSVRELNVIDLVERNEESRGAAFQFFSSEVPVGGCLQMDAAAVSAHEVAADALTGDRPGET